MPGLVPGIHVLHRGSKKDVDGRDEPGHDEKASQLAQLFFTIGQTLFSSGIKASSAGMVAISL
jgi:hypothetical protein